MIDKRGFFNDSRAVSDVGDKMNVDGDVVSSPTHRSASMPNIALHISHTFDENICTVSVIDDDDRILFYRPCHKHYLDLVCNVFNLSRSLDILLSSLEIVTHHDDENQLKP